jgi:hypothetical protein
VVEELDELGPLALGESADGLRLADAALVQEPRSLHAPELRHRHEHVEHLRGRNELRRIEEDRLDVNAACFEVSLELCAADSDVVRSLKGFHPLVEGAGRRLGVRLRRDHEPHESTKMRIVVKR